jgi:hypothetical protein
MLHTLLKLMFWLALVFVAYGAVASPVTYLQHRRCGARIMASEALIAWVLSILCLVVLYLVYDYIA